MFKWIYKFLCSTRFFNWVHSGKAVNDEAQVVEQQVKCLSCDRMIHEIIDVSYNGLCEACIDDNFDEIVNDWRENPETIPGTNGIPNPDHLALYMAAAQLRKELDPDENDLMEIVCHEFFDAAYNKWIEAGSESLSVEEKNVLAAETFYSEVMNGGLIQFLDNSSGAFANWSVNAFEEIGLPDIANVMRSVKELFPEGEIPEDWNKRRTILLEIDDSLIEELQKLFDDRYNYPHDDSEIRIKIYDYVVKLKNNGSSRL